MKKLFLLLVAGLWLTAAAKTAQVTGDVTVVDSAAYFPQLNADGTRLLYSSTEGDALYLKDLTSQETRVVSREGMPGIDAIFGRDGEVCYVTAISDKNNLLYRSIHRFDPLTGNDRIVLKNQRGAVHAIKGSRGTAYVGEHKSAMTEKAGLLAWTLGPQLYVVSNGVQRVLQPVSNTVGYLWAAVSPDGSKLLFVAAGKGLYVCDLQGKILAHLGKYLMPCWLDNEHIVAMGHFGNVQRHSASNLYLLSADGSFSQQLTDLEDGAIQPMVNEQGHVTYTTKSGQVHIMTLEVSE